MQILPRQEIGGGHVKCRRKGVTRGEHGDPQRSTLCEQRLPSAPLLRLLHPNPRTPGAWSHPLRRGGISACPSPAAQTRSRHTRLDPCRLKTPGSHVPRASLQKSRTLCLLPHIFAVRMGPVCHEAPVAGHRLDRVERHLPFVSPKASPHGWVQRAQGSRPPYGPSCLPSGSLHGRGSGES